MTRKGVSDVSSVEYKDVVTQGCQMVILGAVRRSVDIKYWRITT